MAQISIIKKSDIAEARRFDAEYFKPDTLKLIAKIESLPFTRIGKEFDVTKLAGFEYTKYFTKQNLESKNYYPALTSLNIQSENLIEEKSLRIDKDVADTFLSRSRLVYGDVVLSYTGEYRRSLTILKNGFQLGPNICLIRNKTNVINPFYLSTYLNSKVGQTLLDREKTLSGQPTVAMSRIRTIAIPVFSNDFQKDIENKILTAKNKQTQSKQLYKEAEQLLLEELGLIDYKPKHQLTFTTTKKEIDEAKRFDAEYFQPKYKEIIEKIENYDGGFDVVRNQFKQNKILSKRDKESYNYIEIGDVNISNGEIISNKILTKDIPANGKRMLFKGDLLISKVRPYRGAVSFIDFEKENLLGSGAFTVLQEKTGYKKEVLMIFLKTVFIKELLLRYNSGTSYPVIKDEDILNLKIPLIKPEIQKQIAQKIQESHKLRKESKELLEEVKRKVEEEIEK